jgi:uncharacterized protein (DUF1778 family)
MPRKIKAEALRQRNLIPVRVTDEESLLLSKAAEKSRLPLATFVRVTALVQAERSMRPV